jgi:hypothetical protein
MPATAFRIVFLAGQRVLEWTRYYASLADAEFDAPRVVLDAYPLARNITVARVGG